MNPGQATSRTPAALPDPQFPQQGNKPTVSRGSQNVAAHWWINPIITCPSPVTEATPVC